MPKRVYQGDEWVVIVIDLQEDISEAENPELEVLRPDNTIVKWIPTIFGRTCLRYAPSGSDLALVGTYKIQPVLTLHGKRGRGETVTLVVHEKFK